MDFAPAFFDSGSEMRYYALMPSDTKVRYPQLCPFTGEALPDGILKMTTYTSFVFLPGISWTLSPTVNAEYMKVALRVPAASHFVRKIKILRVLAYLAMFVGLGVLLAWIAMWEVKRVPWKPEYKYFIGGGIAVGLLLGRVEKHLTRAIRISDAEEGYTEYCFSSEDYARKFGAANDVQIIEKDE